MPKGMKAFVDRLEKENASLRAEVERLRAAVSKCAPHLAENGPVADGDPCPDCIGGQLDAALETVQAERAEVERLKAEDREVVWMEQIAELQASLQKSVLQNRDLRDELAATADWLKDHGSSVGRSISQRIRTKLWNSATPEQRNKPFSEKKEDVGCAHANIESIGEGCFRRCKDCGQIEPPYSEKKEGV